MIPYNAAFDPPAPFLTIQVSRINVDEPALMVECLVDTGADVSLIPQHLADTLELAPSDAMIVEGFDGEQQQLPLFAVDVVVESVRLNGLEVVSYPTSHAILGRDVLNHLRLLLDGPSQQLEFL